MGLDLQSNVNKVLLQKDVNNIYHRHVDKRCMLRQTEDIYVLPFYTWESMCLGLDAMKNCEWVDNSFA